jgi:hypothetical protein
VTPPAGSNAADHLSAMRSRLPQLWRDGELVNGLLAHADVQLRILDEELQRVQRSHWFGATTERDEAAALAAALDLQPEAWQDLPDFRAWTHALRDAMLERGAVTRRALTGFATEYVRLYQDAAGISAVPRLTAWAREPGNRNEAAFVESPRRVVDSQPLGVTGLEPLATFTLVNRGLDETPLACELVGLPSAPESAPLLVNVTTGEAALFLGDLPPGQRLWLAPGPDGALRARLERADVTSRLRTVHDLEPGRAWTAGEIDAEPRALHLARGENLLWFLPVAHFDVRGLDRVLLALADLDLRQGRFDEGRYDRALFHQHACALLRLLWVETQPARFTMQLPAAALLSAPGALAEALAAREELAFALSASVDRLRPAGVGAEVELLPLREAQPQQEALVAVMPLRLHEAGVMGADALPDAGGLYGVTHFEDSTFR